MQRATTLLAFTQSKVTKQPVPDRYFCYINVANNGYWPTGSGAFNSFGLQVNNPVHPFFSAGGIGTTIPNPGVSINLSDPLGLENLLFNSVTNTGLWDFVRVWKCEVRFTVFGNNTDAFNYVMAPIIGNGGTYSNIEGVEAAPNASKTRFVSPQTTARTTTQMEWDIPALSGTPRKNYSSVLTNAVSFGGTPSPSIYAQLAAYNVNNVVLTARTPFDVQISFGVEFFGRHDYALLNA